MSKTETLKAEPRQRTGSGVLKQMRRDGYVPSVVYGGGVENLNIKLNEKSFRDLLARSASENILVTLELEGGNSQLAFLKDVQHDALSGQMLHADFLAVSETTEITGTLPVELVGEAIGVKGGGQLEQMIYDIEITCMPKDLPEVIEGDVTELDVGDTLQVGALSWPEGVKPTLDDDVVVAMVAKMRVALDEEEELEGAELQGEGAEGEDAEASEATED
jgi:large subunit ribosomal protein L25